MRTLFFLTLFGFILISCSVSEKDIREYGKEKNGKKLIEFIKEESRGSAQNFNELVRIAIDEIIKNHIDEGLQYLEKYVNKMALVHWDMKSLKENKDYILSTYVKHKVKFKDQQIIYNYFKENIEKRDFDKLVKIAWLAPSSEWLNIIRELAAMDKELKSCESSIVSLTTNLDTLKDWIDWTEKLLVNRSKSEQYIHFTPISMIERREFYDVYDIIIVVKDYLGNGLPTNIHCALFTETEYRTPPTSLYSYYTRQVIKDLIGYNGYPAYREIDDENRTYVDSRKRKLRKKMEEEKNNRKTLLQSKKQVTILQEKINKLINQILS